MVRRLKSMVPCWPEPGNIDAFADLGQCYIAVGEIDMAQMLIAKIPGEHRDRGPLVALVKAIELARQASGLGELDELDTKAEANPGDHQARLDYALALNGEGEREAATEQLIAIVRADRKWKDDGARTQMMVHVHNCWSLLKHGEIWTRPQFPVGEPFRPYCSHKSADGHTPGASTAWQMTSPPLVAQPSPPAAHRCVRSLDHESR